VKRLLALALLCACAAPFRWEPPTPEAVAGRRIGDRLERCLDAAGGWPEYVAACGYEAAAACHRASLPKDCGRVALWFKHVGGARPGSSIPGARFPPVDQL
jgi:hypothetical protein